MYMDIGARKKDFPFHLIRSAARFGDYLFVDHIAEEGRRELKTFKRRKEDGSSRTAPHGAGKSDPAEVEGWDQRHVMSAAPEFTDTGNRYLPMDAFDLYALPRIDISYVKRGLDEHKLKRDAPTFRRLRDKGWEICDIEDAEDDGIYLLVWSDQEREGRLLHGLTQHGDLKTNPLCKFAAQKRPGVFVRLEQAQVFLIAGDEANRFYIVDGKRDLSDYDSRCEHLFDIPDATLARHGDVKEMHNITTADGDVLIIVQEHCAGILFVREFTFDNWHKYN